MDLENRDPLSVFVIAVHQPINALILFYHSIMLPRAVERVLTTKFQQFSGYDILVTSICTPSEHYAQSHLIVP